MVIAHIETLQNSSYNHNLNWQYLIVTEWRVAGCGLHGAAGGGGVAEAGADQGGETRAQLHDGHSAYQEG